MCGVCDDAVRPHLVFGLLLCFFSAAGLQGRVTGDGAYWCGLQENGRKQSVVKKS